MGGGFCSLSLICRRLISSDRISGFPGCRANFRDAPGKNFVQKKSHRLLLREAVQRADKSIKPRQSERNLLQRPSSPRPSPPGEGEPFAASLKNPRLDLPDGHSENQKRA